MKTIALALLASSLCACSTTSMIVTNPPGANVYIKGQFMGQSPVEVDLTDGFVDGANYWVKLTKQGYKTQEIKLRQSWAVGYIVLDALLCIPTFGLGCYLIYLNGRTHECDYHFLLEPGTDTRPPPPPVPGPEEVSALPNS